jgi:hypothetical protein
MTWIIGKPTKYGHGLLISDIAVTYANKHVENCLQKVYVVGNCIAAGFSGSVELGFRLVQDLQYFLSSAPESTMWQPEDASLKWHRRARRIFKESSQELQILKSEILLVGVSPSTNSAPTLFPTIYAIALRSPDFNPEFSTKEAISIGSGSHVKEYMKRLSEVDYSKDTFAFEFEFKTKQLGIVHADRIARIIQSNPQSGISEDLNICIVKTGEISISFTESYEMEDSDSLTKHNSPKLYKSWEELVKHSQNLSLEAGISTC